MNRVALGKGAIVGILGGIVAMVGAMLPWWNVTASAGGFSVGLPVLGIFWIGGILALVFGILGLVFSALKQPVMGILALVMGLLVAVVSMVYGAMVPTASVSAGGASGSITAGFGYWISLIGGLLLAIGGAIGFIEGRKAPAIQTAPPAPY